MKEEDNWVEATGNMITDYEMLSPERFLELYDSSDSKLEQLNKQIDKEKDK